MIFQSQLNFLFYFKLRRLGIELRVLVQYFIYIMVNISGLNNGLILYFYLLLIIYIRIFIEQYHKKFIKDVNMLCIFHKKSFNIVPIYNSDSLCYIFEISLDIVNLCFFISKNIMFPIIRYICMHFFNQFLIVITFYTFLIFVR